MNWAQSDPKKLREPARALRVALLISSWVHQPGAIDNRAYDQRVLDALK
jgi:hypothetical protein